MHYDCRPRLADLRHRLIGLGANLVTTEGSLHRDLGKTLLYDQQQTVSEVPELHDQYILFQWND